AVFRDLGAGGVKVGGGAAVADRPGDDRSVVGRSRRAAPQPGFGHPAELAHLLWAISPSAVIAGHPGRIAKHGVSLRGVTPSKAPCCWAGAEPASKRPIVNPGEGSQACRPPPAPKGELSTRRKFRVPESPSEPTALCFGDRIVAVGPSEGGPPLPRSGRN